MPSLEIHAIAGPIEGHKHKLRTDDPLLIGRTARGLNLPDPQVSRRHAEISYEGDRFWIQDLDSMTGTMVDGRTLGPEPVALEPGMKISIGETVFEVRQKRRARQLALWVLFVLTLFMMYPVAKLGVKIGMNIAKPGPQIIFDAAINQGGSKSSEILDLDPCFMRVTGQGEKSTRIRRITDFDEDGVSEIWLQYPWNIEETVVPKYERVYSFNEDHSWLLMGELPVDCLDVPTAPKEFPNLICHRTGESFRFTKGSPLEVERDGCSVLYARGQYVNEGIGDQAVVAWMPSKTAGAPPEPFQFTLDSRKRYTLAGFLAERKVTKPVHFIICESAIEGMSAQVLTEDGVITKLSKGCHKDIHLDGVNRVSWFGDRQPVALSFTAIGRQKLVDQLAIFRSGCPDDLFWSPEDRKLLEVVGRNPVGRPSVLVSFHAGNRLFRSDANEAAQLNVRGRLVADPVYGPLPHRCEMWTSPSESPPPHPLRPSNTISACSKLKVGIGSWRCGTLCAEGDTFVTVDEVGCPNIGNRLSLSYDGGVVVRRYKDMEIRGQARAEGNPIDVIDLRLGWRSVAEQDVPRLKSPDGIYDR